MKTLAVVALALICTATLAGAAAQSRRDPFARPAAALAAPPAAEAGEAAPAPRLRAVMFEPGKSLANIDGRIVAVGDSFGSYRVAAIGERSATLIRRGVRSVIVIDEESSK